MKNKLPIAFIIFSSVFLSIHAYLLWKLAFAPGLSPLWKVTITTLLLLGFLLIVTRLAFYKSIPKIFSTLHAYFAYCWMGMMFFLLTAFALSDFILMVLPSSIFKILGLEQSNLNHVQMQTVLTLTGLTGLFAFCQAKCGPKLKKVDVRLSKFPKALSGFKIVQISDLHIGDIIQDSYVNKVVQQCNAQNPDLIVITGDLIDAPFEHIGHRAQGLAALSAKHGVYFVTGNHEYYAGAEAWIDYLKTIGIETLRNESVIIGDQENSFYLVGIDDPTGKGFLPGHGSDLKKAVHTCDDDKAKILLAHQPKSIKDAEQYKIDLQLSGHTHNGQIWPFNYLVALDQPYLKGLYQHRQTQIYVNPGTGFWGPPMRFWGRSEITVLNIN